MPGNINKIFAILLLLALVLPAKVAFDPAGMQTVQAAQIKALPAISVSYAAKDSHTVFVQKTLNPSECAFALSSANSLQGGSGLNLNQPADCFNLVTGGWEPLAQSLSVRSLPEQAVKVAVLPYVLKTPALAPSSQKLPEGIQAFSVLGAMAAIFAFGGRRSRVRQAVNLKALYSRHVGVIELMSLRC